MIWNRIKFSYDHGDCTCSQMIIKRPLHYILLITTRNPSIVRNVFEIHYVHGSNETSQWQVMFFGRYRKSNRGDYMFSFRRCWGNSSHCLWQETSIASYSMMFWCSSSYDLMSTSFHPSQVKCDYPLYQLIPLLDTFKKDAPCYGYVSLDSWIYSHW